MKNSTTPEEARVLQAEQVRQLYAGLPSALVANPVIAGIVAYMQYSVIARQTIIFWLLMIAMVILLRWMLHGKYRAALGSGEVDRAPAGWLVRFRVLSLATGVTWALGAYLLFPPGDFAHQMFLAFVLSGLAAGGANSLAADFLAAMGYTFPPLAVLAVTLGMQDSPLYHAMAGMVLLLIAYLFATGRRTQGILLETARLRLQDRQRNATLHTQQQNLRSILDNAPIGIWRQDKDGRLLFVNRQFCDAVGIPEEKFVAVPHYADLYDETTARRCIASDMAAMVAKGPYVSHEQMRLADGELHELEITKVQLHDEAGSPDGLIGISTDVTRQRQMESTLREQQRLLQQMLEHQSVAAFVIDADHRVKYWNRACEELTGLRARDVIGTRDAWRGFYRTQRPVLADLVLDNATENASRYYQKQGASSLVDAGWHAEDWFEIGGKRRYVYFDAAPIFDEVGRPIAAIETLQDITEQKIATTELESNTRHLQSVLDNVADAIITIDERGVVRSFNRAAENSFGYAAREVIGRNISMLMPEPHRGQHDAYLRRYFETGVPHVIGIRREVEGQRKDGTLFPVSLGVSILEHNDRPMFIGLIHDITETKRIEHELQAGQERASQALDALKQQKFALDQHAIVAITDVQGRIIYANDKFCQISGYSREELMGRDHAMLNSGYHPHGFFKRMYRTVARGDTWHDEICNRNKDGRLYWVATTIVPFMGADGKPEQYIAIRSDITERKRAETDLLKHRDHLQTMILEQTRDLRLAKDAAERANQAKSEFLANMSHELRTPMHAILSFSELGESRISTAPPDKLQGYFQRIHSSGARLLDLLNDLLDLSKLEAGKMTLDLQPHSLFKLAEESVTEFGVLATAQQLRLTLEPCPFDTTTQVDAKRFGQVVRNLLSNAIKFTPAGGTVTVHFEAATLPRGRRAGDRGLEPAIALEVCDSGVGIPETELESVFDKFVQSSKTKNSAGGTGLGLAICKEMVEAHRGTIMARNNPEGGSTFTVTLPLIDLPSGAEA